MNLFVVYEKREEGNPDKKFEAIRPFWCIGRKQEPNHTFASSTNRYEITNAYPSCNSTFASTITARIHLANAVIPNHCQLDRSFIPTAIDEPIDYCCPQQRCEYDAPEQINVYPDGSLINARTNSFKLAGAGVWWPNRKLNEKPFSEAEQGIALHEHEEVGLELSAAIAGLGGSST